MREELADHPPLARVVEELEARFGEAVVAVAFEKGELSAAVAPESLMAVLGFLKAGLGFNILDDVIGLDRFPAPGDGRKRFSVLYQLYQYPGRLRVRIVIDVDEDDAVPSVLPLFRSAVWAEREVYDMFGLRFSGHSGLKRIYLPDEFEGHPLRKDFPLEGKDHGAR
jgi:NADH-quinone oxidoreductase subunit C